MPLFHLRRAGKSQKMFTVEGRFENGDIRSDTYELASERERQRAADATGLTVKQILDLYVPVHDGKLVISSVEVETPIPPVKFCIRVRGIHQPETAASEPFVGDEVENILAAVFASDVRGRADPIAYWEGTENLCRLDVDYHGMPLDSRPSPDWLNRKIDSALRPTPVVAWATRGRGVAAVYTSADGYTAEELAAVAGLTWITQDSTATVELKSSFRLPTSHIRWIGQTVDLSTLGRSIGQAVDESAVDAWLTENHFVRGKSYPHSRCPIRPGHGSHGEPVFIGNGGIFCQSCAAGGFARGSRRPGFVPYAFLLDGRLDNVLYHCGRHLCHWSHSRWIVYDRLCVSDGVGQPAFRALCKMLVGVNDPRIAAVFAGGRNLVRRTGQWITSNGEMYKDNHLSPIIRRLPAARRPDGSVDDERVARLMQPIDLYDYGYPAVTIVRGMKVWGQHLTYSDPRRVNLVIGEGRYLPVGARATAPEIRSTYEDVFPGINWEYLQLLICAKGCAEGAVGKPPLIIVDGPAGAAKTGTCQVAASTLGDKVGEVQYTSNTERLRQSVMEAILRGSYCVCNEIMKDGGRSGLTPVQSLDPILNLTPDSMSHAMYVGPVPLGQLPVMVFTDVTIPPEIREDTQLARRLIHVRLYNRLEWDAPMLASGLGSAADFRRSSRQRSYAADSLVSNLIDEYFNTETNFGDIARQLGFNALENSTEYDDPDILLNRFFHLVDGGPELPEGYRSWLSGPGWTLIRRNDSSELAETWRTLCDGEGVAFSRSRKVMERDWRMLLKSKSTEPIVFECKSHREIGVIAVRFRTGSAKRPTAVNAKVLV